MRMLYLFFVVCRNIFVIKFNYCIGLRTAVEQQKNCRYNLEVSLVSTHQENSQGVFSYLDWKRKISWAWGSNLQIMSKISREKMKVLISWFYWGFCMRREQKIWHSPHIALFDIIRHSRKLMFSDMTYLYVLKEIFLSCRKIEEEH